MTNPARTERAALCDLFLDVGPDAPTLCGDWSTRDLAAHLVVRERRPDAAVGIVVRAAAGYGESVRRRVASQPFERTVATIRSGPPLWSPATVGLVDRLMNTVEFFVHHEDVRRGGGSMVPRNLDASLDHELWSALSRMARMLARKAPAGLVLTAPGRGSITAKSGDPAVTVTGTVGELVLFVYGRQAHAAVELDGPADLVAAMRTASFGI